jgi:hypothetical protein
MVCRLRLMQAGLVGAWPGYAWPGHLLCCSNVADWSSDAAAAQLSFLITHESVLLSLASTNTVLLDTV